MLTTKSIGRILKWKLRSKCCPEHLNYNHFKFAKNLKIDLELYFWLKENKSKSRYKGKLKLQTKQKTTLNILRHIMANTRLSSNAFLNQLNVIGD